MYTSRILFYPVLYVYVPDSIPSDPPLGECNLTQNILSCLFNVSHPRRLDLLRLLEYVRLDHLLSICSGRLLPGVRDSTLLRGRTRRDGWTTYGRGVPRSASYVATLR